MTCYDKAETQLSCSFRSKKVRTREKFGYKLTINPAKLDGVLGRTNLCHTKPKVPKRCLFGDLFVDKASPASNFAPEPAYQPRTPNPQHTPTTLVNDTKQSIVVVLETLSAAPCTA